jgi:hypothetical protein
MAADNQTTIAGNLVEDPELRFTNTGIPVTNLRVAVTQRIQQDGEWRDGETSFFKVNVWRGQADHLADSLAKGDRFATAKVDAPTSGPLATVPGAGPAGRTRRRLQRPATLLSTVQAVSAPDQAGGAGLRVSTWRVADHQRSTLHNVRGSRFPAIVLPPAHRRPRSPQWSSASASSLSAAATSPRPRHSTRPSAGTWMGAWRPCARATARPAPCSGQPACPRRPGRRREGRRQLGHGIDSSPESGYKRATNLRKLS